MKESNVDELLAIVVAILVFMVGLAWNMVIDTAIKLYAEGNSLTLLILYACAVTMVTFIVGDYIINRLNVYPKYSTDCALHKAIRWMGGRGDDEYA